jgi:hypothetical protein
VADERPVSTTTAAVRARARLVPSWSRLKHGPRRARARRDKSFRTVLVPERRRTSAPLPSKVMSYALASRRGLKRTGTWVIGAGRLAAG